MSSEEQANLEQVEIEAHWIGVEETPILAANQLIAQVNQGEVFLTFGQVAPPAVLGTDEQRRAQLEGLTVSIRAIARMHLTPDRLEEMVGALNEVLKRHREQERARAQLEADQ